jgi:uncharacterized heparinase superfamily protein
LSLDGIGSSSASGPFNWVSKADVRLISSESTPIARVVAEHDGYVGQYGVKHRRNVEFDGASRFTIVDELVGGPTDRRVTVSFLLDPACQSTFEHDRNGLLITQNNCELIRIGGDQATELGWLSPSFGVRIPTDQILFESHLHDTTSTITIEVL